MAASLSWISAWIGGSILYRRNSGKPLFPRAPDNAVFAEAWRSGRSLRNPLSRIGGGRGCLLVYVADEALTIVPQFPFNLMFLPDIFGLETTIPITDIKVTRTKGLLGAQLLLTIEGVKPQRFEIRLHDQQSFLDALESRAAPANLIPQGRGGSPRIGWRPTVFRVFAVIWGLGAAAAGVAGLEQGFRFRSHGVVATARMVGHTGEAGARNDAGIVQYEVDGRPYRLTSLRGSGVYKIGEAERVYYLPDDPYSAREGEYLAFDALFAGLGVGMLFLAFSIGRIARVFARAMNLPGQLP